MDSFLELSGLGLWKEQQQMALKLYKTFPGESRYLYWTLLSIILQFPNRCSHHTGPRDLILVSIAHRCLHTLLHQDPKLRNSSSESPIKSPLEEPNSFWMVLKVLEMVGQWFPEEDHSKVFGIGKLNYPESLVKPFSSFPQVEVTPGNETSKDDLVNQAQLSSQVASLDLSSNVRPIRLIKSGSPGLPRYISCVREDYLEICDSDLGREMRKKYLNLELVWRQRAVEWANSTGLKELICRMKQHLSSGDRNWSTMTTLNQSVANLLRIEESAINELKLLDDFYVELNANQKAQKETERGYCLAQVDLRCRFRDPFLSNSQRNFPPLENLDQAIHSYFIQFGEKTCCFDDLVPYLNLLTSDEANKLSIKLKQISHTFIDQDCSFCESSVRRQINLNKIIRSVVSYTVDQQATEATRLLQSYFKYLPLGHDLPATALQPADGLAILAAQTLIQDWQGPDGNVSNLYSATYILEASLAKSTHQYQARSLLIRLHRLLGNCPRNLLLFVGFDIKHIQHDTLSHLGLDRCSIFFSDTLPSARDPEDTESRPHVVQDLIEYPALMYEYIEADTVSWINNCYVDRNYIQVEDLYFFKHQINSSLQRKILRMERIRLQLFEKTRSLLDTHKKDDNTRAKNQKNNHHPTWDAGEIEMIISEVLRDCQCTIDNRDFTVIPDCQPWSRSGTCHQTSLGPLLGNRWLWTIGTTYARIIVPHLQIPDHPLLSQPDFFSECSPYEIQLNEYSKALGYLMFSPERHLLESKAGILVDFFQRRNDEFETLITAPIEGHQPSQKVPPIQLLSIIHNVYEGFCFFDLAFRQFGRSSFPSLTKNRTHVVKVFGCIKTKILSKLKKLDLLIQKLLSVMTTNTQLLEHRNISSTQEMTCLFGSSPGIQFPWRDDAMDKDFGNEVNWNKFLFQINSEQRQTIDGWHSLIKLITKNYHST